MPQEMSMVCLRNSNKATGAYGASVDWDKVRRRPIGRNWTLHSNIGLDGVFVLYSQWGGKT